MSREELLEKLGCKPVQCEAPYDVCLALPEPWHAVMVRCGGSLVLECEDGDVRVEY